jgi:hypothetical protein
MSELKYKPVRHNHDAFLKKAKKREGFCKAYEALETEYALANERLSANTKAATRKTAIN